MKNLSTIKLLYGLIFISIFCIISLVVYQWWICNSPNFHEYHFAPDPRLPGCPPGLTLNATYSCYPVLANNSFSYLNETGLLVMCGWVQPPTMVIACTGTYHVQQILSCLLLQVMQVTIDWRQPVKSTLEMIPASSVPPTEPVSCVVPAWTGWYNI